MQKRLGVVFVSRRNSLRSVLAEACLTHLDGKRFAASSCGQPGEIASAFSPAAVQALQTARIALPASSPRNWNRLVHAGASRVDFVIALDESLASNLPSWPGQPDVAVWPYPDAEAAGMAAEQATRAAIQMLYSLRRRLELLVSLPLSGSDRSAVRSDIRDMAYMR